jgi:hypothetical protein
MENARWNGKCWNRFFFFYFFFENENEIMWGWGDIRLADQMDGD